MLEFRRQVNCIFCDDIRQEVGNKLTLVGMYQGIMQFEHPFPVTIPKLCVLSSIQTPIERPFKRLNFVLYQDDVVIASQEFDEDALKAVQANGEADSETRVVVQGVGFTMNSLRVEKECTIRLRVETEDGEFPSLGLKIKAK